MKWQDQARSLGYGQRMKVACCSSSPSTYVSNDRKGIRLGPCFRCGHSEWEPHANLTMKDRLRMRKQTDELRGLRRRPKTVPLAEAPHEAKLWVLKVGLSPEEATEVYGMRWAEKYQRVIVPIMQDMQDTGAFLARSVDKRQQPKYVASSDAQGKLWYAGTGATVLVEDVLSAIVVHRAGFRAVAAMGTVMTHAVMRAATRDTHLVGWFDDDAAGNAAWRGLRAAMGLYDTALYRVQSDRDPKMHSAEEIQALVNRAIGE